MDNFLQQGIAAAKAGDKARAFQLLTRAAQDNSTAEQAWLWLSSVVSTDGERLFCLGNVLRINPNNPHAKPAATMLRQKGVFPSAPTPPAVAQSPAPVISRPIVEPQNAPQPAASIVQEQDDAVGWLDTLATEHGAKSAVIAPAENDMTSYFKYVTLELANNKPPMSIVKGLTDRGLHPEVASRIVNETESLLKKSARRKTQETNDARSALDRRGSYIDLWELCLCE